MPRSAAALPDWFDGLIDRATRTDGQPPFSDQSLVEARDGRRTLVTIDEVAAAIVLEGVPAEFELVVDPGARGEGHGSSLIATLLEQHPHALIWAHGDSPAARHLAASHGLEPVRTLLQLRSPVSAPLVDAEQLEGFRSFHPGADDTALLRLNAAAFEHHPEQGGLDQADLDARMSEPWFDADDLLLLEDDDALIAFCWLKIEDGIGEFYVVGVDPSRQGEGLGKRLVAAGLAHLHAKGIATASLYVDEDNTAAVRLYRRFGFANHTVDIQYRSGAEAS